MNVVRRHGIAAPAVGYGRGDQLSWSFDGHADSRRHALAFLAEGRRGQRLHHTTDRSVDDLRHDAGDGLDGAARLLESGALPVDRLGSTQRP